MSVLSSWRSVVWCSALHSWDSKVLIQYIQCYNYVIPHTLREVKNLHSPTMNTGWSVCRAGVT